MKVAVIGSFIVDLMARAPHLPEAGETVFGSLFKIGPGGKGFNQALAAKRAGCNLMFSAKVGDDDFSKIALDACKKAGISKDYIFIEKNIPTGAALIPVDEVTGQNEIIVVPGASTTFSDGNIKQLDVALNESKYLMMQMEINMNAAEKLISLAYEKGIRVILNTAPVQKLSDDLYKQLYLVTPNEVEARILTGISCDTPDGYRAASEFFLEKGVAKVIITLGKRGAYLNDGDKEYLLPCYDVPVLDTTGAGDAFNGGLLAGLSQSMPLHKAATFGNIISNIAVTKLGTASAMPDLQEINEFIKAHGIKL